MLASPTPRMAGRRNTFWPPPTGCPATWIGVSRSPSRCSIRIFQARIREILDTQLAEPVKARRILADGSSERLPTSAARALRSQQRLYEITGAEGSGASWGALAPDTKVQ